MNALTFNAGFAPSRIRLADIRRRQLLTAHLRMLLLGGGFLFIALVALLRIAWLGVVQPAPVEHSMAQALLPARGEITDRNGVPLARAFPAYALWYNPDALGDGGPPLVKSPTEVATRLHAIFPDLDVTQTAQFLAAGKPGYIRRRVLPDEVNEVNAIGELALETPDEVDRQYPQGQLAAHVLGYDRIGLAVRYDNYSDVGHTTNPKFGVNWVPFEGLKLRGSYGTSFRAPTFPEIFGNSSRLYVQNHQNPTGGAALPVFKIGSGPNPDLKPETATTWTVGADFQPTRRLKLSVTYFDIAYKNTIAGLLSNLSILTYADQYAGTDVILFGKAAYDRIIDIRDNGIAGTGPIPVFPIAGASTACIDNPQPPNYSNCIFADGRSLNLGRSKMQGIDFDVQYRMELGASDTLTLSAKGTYLTVYDVAFTPGGDYVSLKNHIYNPLTFKARGVIDWDHGPFTVRAQLQHVGGYINDIVTPAENVSSYNLVDLMFDWRMGDSFDLGHIKGLTLGLEVLNLFDTDPPYVNSRQGQNSGGGFDPTVTNPIGREFAISLRAKY